MKTFIIDYIDLCKHTLRFGKNHWKGILAIYGIEVAALGVIFALEAKKEA